MYTQVEKLKEGRSRAVVDSTDQKKNNRYQRSRFFDNRQKTITQRKIQKIVDSQILSIQLKKDHLFNDVPKVIAQEGGGERAKRQEIILRNIRDQYHKDDVYGPNEVDLNTEAYAKSLSNFRSATLGLRGMRNGTNKLWVELRGRQLWKDSVDDKVKNSLGKQGESALNAWNEEMMPSINAVIDDICE